MAHMVAHVITTLNVGGAENSLKRLIVESGRENDMCVISLFPLGSIAEDLEQYNIDVYSLNIVNMRSYFIAFFTLMRLLRKIQPDIVHTWLYHSDLIGGVVAKLLRIKTVIWSIRTTNLRRGSVGTSIVRRVNALLSYFIPDKIICVAYASYHRHIELGYCKKKMEIIPNGYDFRLLKKDVTRSERLRETLGIPTNHIVVGSIGRLSEVKGQDIFIRNAGVLAKSFPHVVFLMIGRGVDPSSTQLFEWVQQTGCPEKFMLVGEQSDMIAYLGAIDIFCLHSRSEGFPNVLVEAMAMEIPCVATNVGDAAYIGNDMIEIAIEPENLAIALAKLVKMDKAKRRGIGLMLRNNVMSRFSIDIVVNAYKNLYAAARK